MRSRFPLTACLFLLIFTPTYSLASGAQGQDHGHSTPVATEKQDEHLPDGGMAIVGTMTSKGVKGMAHIKDVSEIMAKLGLKKTHHFMIAFADTETGEQIDSGTVTLKLINPDAKVTEMTELTGMDGHFGVDITLDMEGEYHFRLETMLKDGVQRKYHFHYVN